MSTQQGKSCCIKIATCASGCDFILQKGKIPSAPFLICALLLSSSQAGISLEILLPGLPSQSFMYTQLPPAEAFCKHSAFNPQNLKVVGVLRKIVKPQGRLWGQRATQSSPVPAPQAGSCFALSQGMGPGAPPPPGSSQDTPDERGWHVRQVPSGNRHGSPQIR